MQMEDFYEFGSELAQTYKEKCKSCSREIEISTQKDDHPEYYIKIYVRCICGKSVKFILPVN